MSALPLPTLFTRVVLNEHTAAIRERAAALSSWIVEVTFPVFGLGPVVDIGCGDTTLVSAFRARGITASAIDLMSGADVADVEAETVFLVHVLEWLDEDDLESFLSDVRDVVGRDLFVVVDSKVGGNGVPRLREWWEKQLVDAGFARHPLSLTLTPYESLEKEGDVVILAARRLPDSLLQKCPREALLKERGLHMDMLRESGRRADAHLARYALAATFVRPRDRVLDAACGLGYGAAMLTEASLANSVLGIDSSASAVEYARSAYGLSARFDRCDVSSLSETPAGSLDLIVSFETIEHIEDPDAFLREACRILTPGGRFICSVPNRWVDETGRDPNPYHLHVFDRASILQLCGRYFRIERLFGQTAGGGMKASAVARGWSEVDPTSQEGSDPEWWVVVAMKDPVPEPSAVYREALSAHASCGEWTVTAFERYYENPWVVRALVSRGLRATSSSLLMTMAREVFDRSIPFSADAGAALCVLAYGYAGTATIPGWLTAALQSYCLAPEGNPHVERWRISNEYALARIYLEAGRTDEARALFERCALRDCLRFSPLLGTKTIDAAFWAGWLAMQARDTAGAGQWWTRGLEEARRVLAADWTNVIGSIEEPLLFGMRELTEVADLASRCASGLHLLTEFGDRPGVAAAQTWRSLGGLLQAREHELALTRRSMNAISATYDAERRWRAEHEAAMAAGMEAMEAAVAFTRDEAHKRALAYDAALEAEREHVTFLKSSLDASIAHAASLEAAVGAVQSEMQHLRRTWVALALRLVTADPRGVAIFGAGQGGRQFAQTWRQKGGHVACFVNNDAATWGSVLDGIPVEPPFTLEARKVALVIVASLAHAAISEQLTRMNLVEGQDFISWVNVPGVDGHDHDA